MTSPNTPENSPSSYPPSVPPGQFPPAFYPPMFLPQPREGGGFARAIFTTLAVSVLGFSITLNIYLLIANGLFSGDSVGVQRQTLTDGNSQTIIAVVPVQGMIWEEAYNDLDKILREVEKDSAVKAVVLEIDSPGGEVSASDEMYNRLLRFKKESNIPLVVSMGSRAASGGYYIACAADHIVARQTTETGSIGVLVGGLNFAKLLEKYGVEDRTLIATGATLKLAGSPVREPTPAETAYLQRQIDSQFGLFKSVVMAGRQLDQATVDRLATGQVYLGAEARQLKLVDDLGSLDTAIQIAAKKAGIAGAQVVRFRREQGFWASLGGGQMKANMVETDLGGTRISIDRQMFDRLTSPRPMFLYRGM